MAMGISYCTGANYNIWDFFHEIAKLDLNCKRITKQLKTRGLIGMHRSPVFISKIF